ncbi:alpha/beta fold hydrolase [Paenibacillus naphthalenovorans]|uniref:4,5:9,10-diseco-3-hydroxy-5,9, 17-trioxoandrosta-1(10),2-diene-4-oate hydrolase n=1 Tax=Paenibacillus naphthalenovorans TaxID=162209 RepID=A0A0U2M718_9BACL|nr:alpha/beta hydrolase [Paenibacillus naphthalenovorans]ALS23872.1 4,5:9,10-diseco-3-hydroxy-5,9,17-trioxoandrosta-1(10),2-diene-4-oate hydrolase [Paenibacillus naphthalenovorans]
MGEKVAIWTQLAGLPLKQYYLDVDGIRTRVMEAGEGEQTLIFVHGTGGHLEAYSRNFAGLADEFRVIAYDMVGHGFSDKPDRPYTIDYLSDHLVGLVKALHLQKVSLSGESLGGWVAAWTAAYHPELIDKLILNTPGNITNKPQVMEQVKNSTIKAVEEATYDNVRARLEWLFYDKSFVTDELVSIRYKIYKQPEFKRAVYHIVAVQDWEIRKNYVWSPEWCNRITCPTLLLWTDNDPTGTVDEAFILKEWIPGSLLYVINDSGHWPQWESMEEFNRVHTAFVKEGGF